MSYYIVCNKKRNNPRMNVLVCRKKCDMKDHCQEYSSYHKIEIQNKHNSLPKESHSVGLEAA